jgi:hypothetical protein
MTDNFVGSAQMSKVLFVSDSSVIRTYLKVT